LRSPLCGFAASPEGDAPSGLELLKAPPEPLRVFPLSRCAEGGRTQWLGKTSSTGARALKRASFNGCAAWNYLLHNL